MTSAIYILVVLLNAAAILCCITYKEKRLPLAVSMCIFAFFAEYIIIGGILFLADIFCIAVALAAMSAANAAGLCVLRLKQGKPFKDVKHDMTTIKLGFIMAAFLISFTKFGYFGMGQDQGVYQIRAMDMMYGSAQRIKSFSEYDSLSEPQKSDYREFIGSFVTFGFDEYDSSLPALTEEGKPNDVSGVYHGIPTYPAVLALWGSMFGMHNMSGVNSLLFVGIIIAALYLCDLLKADTPAAVTAMSVMTFSPLLVWTAKSSLTELFLAYIIVMYIYFIMQSDRLSIILSAVPLVAYSFYHVTVYTTLPLFMFLYIALYLRTEKRAYITASLIFSAGFAVGFTMMIYSSPKYTSTNVVRPFSRLLGSGVDRLGAQAMLALLFLMAAVFAAAALLCTIGRIRKIVRKPFIADNSHMIYRIFGAAMLLICVYNITKLESVNQSPLFAFSYVTGFLIFPVVLFLVFRKTKELLSTDSGFVLISMFMYLVLFRSALLAKTVEYYYYYCRYLAPFVIIIALLAAALIKNCTIKKISVAAAVCLTLPFDFVLLAQKDDTMMQWSMLDDICGRISEDDAVIIGERNYLHYRITFPVKEVSGAAVFPFFESTELSEQLSQLDEQYDRVFLICTTEFPDGIDGCTEIYSEAIRSSEDVLFDERIKMFPLPHIFKEDERLIHMYEYTP